MSYQIIPNWTYLGKPVYTKDNDDELNISVPVATAMPLLDEPLYQFPSRNRASLLPRELEYISLEKGASLSSIHKVHTIMCGYGSDEKSKYKLGQEGFSCQSAERVAGGFFKSNKNPVLYIPPNFTVYEKHPYQQRYDKLGHFVRVFTDPHSSKVYYYFSEDPEKGYETRDLYYDPNITPEKEVATKKGGRKTRKYRKTRK